MENLIHELRAYATDNRWVDSWDVAAFHWSDEQVASAIAGAKTRRGAIAKAWAHIRAINANRTDFRILQLYGPKPVKSVSLFQFLAKRGGLRPRPELQAILDGNPFIGGQGPLVRRRGMELDDARQAAVDAGYLYETPWEGGVAVSTVNQLLDLIADEARGRKVYPMGELGESPEDDFQADDPAYHAEESCYDIPY